MHFDIVHLYEKYKIIFQLKYKYTTIYVYVVTTELSCNLNSFAIALTVVVSTFEVMNVIINVDPK